MSRYVIVVMFSCIFSGNIYFSFLKKLFSFNEKRNISLGQVTHQVKEQYDLAFLRSHKYFLMNSLRRHIGVKNAIVLGHVVFLTLIKASI